MTIEFGDPIAPPHVTYCYSTCLNTGQFVRWTPDGVQEQMSACTDPNTPRRVNVTCDGIPSTQWYCSCGAPMPAPHCADADIRDAWQQMVPGLPRMDDPHELCADCMNGAITGIEDDGDGSLTPETSEGEADA